MEDIRKTIVAIMEGRIPLNSTWATVKSISGDKCTVIINELEIEDILLGFDKSGVIVYPKVNTDILVMFTDNSKTNGAVVVVKETDKVEIMGNTKGGLSIVSKLTDRYNKLEQDLNNLKQIFTSWTPVTYDGGAALKSASAAWASQQLIETQDSDIENTKVKHGDG